MCGITAGFSKTKDMNEEVLLQFEDQSSRGTNGFGSIFINEDGTFKIDRATGQIKAIIDAYRTPSKMMIFHHRMPSSSKNKISQTHPIKISAGSLKHDYYFVHNGVCRNEKARKEVHNNELGYVYSTDVEVIGWGEKKERMFNDSESLGYDIARFIEGQADKIETYASAAFIMTQVDKKTQKITKIFYGRNTGNPLNIANTRGYLFLSSEGKGEAIKEDILYSFTPENFKIKKTPMVIESFAKTEPIEKEANNKTEVIGFRERYKDTFVDDEDDFGSYSHRKTKDYPDEDEWMAWEEEEEMDKYFNLCQLELDNLRDFLKEAKGSDVYLVDAEDTIKTIAKNVALGVNYAQSLKASIYMSSEADSDSPLTADSKEYLPVVV